MYNRFLLLSAWLILILSTSLIIFNMSINSDGLIFADLFRNFLSLGGTWQNWRLNPSPSYFLEMPLYFLAYKLFPLLTDRSLFVTMIEAILIASVNIWLAKVIKHDLSVRAKVALILLVSFVSLTSANSGLLMYFSKTNYHISALVFGILSLGCLVQYLATARWLYAALLIIWVALAIPSDMVYFISFYLTAILILGLGLLFFYFKYNFPLLKYRFIKSLIILIIGFLVGKLLNMLLTYNAPLTVGIDFKSEGDSFAYIIHATFNSFKFDNKYTLMFSLLVLASLAYLVVMLCRSFSIKYKKMDIVQTRDEILFGVHFNSIVDYKLVFVGLFLVLLLPINMGCLIIASHGDLAVYRYYMLPLALIFIQTVVNLDRSPKLQGWLTTLFLWILVIVFAIIINATAKIFLPNEGLKNHRLGVFGDNDIFRLTQCIEQLDNTGTIPLRSGVAEYWHARSVKLFLKKHNFIADVKGFGDLHPSFWMATKDPFLYPKRYQIYYNFVILIKDKPLSLAWNDFSPETIGKLLPKGYINYVCPNDANFEIWVYPGNELNKFMEANISQFLFARDEVKYVNWLGMQLPTQVGYVVNTALVANSKTSHAGFVTLGPSVNLRKGKYIISIHYSANFVNPNFPTGIWRIGKFDDHKQRIILAQGEFLNRQNAVITVTIQILSRTLYGTEIRTWFSGLGNLKIDSISIEKL